MDGDRLTKRVETINAGQARKASFFGEAGKSLSALQTQRRSRTPEAQNAAVELMAARFAAGQDIWTGKPRDVKMDSRAEIEVDDSDDFITWCIKNGEA